MDNKEMILELRPKLKNGDMRIIAKAAKISEHTVYAVFEFKRKKNLSDSTYERVIRATIAYLLEKKTNNNELTNKIKEL